MPEACPPGHGRAGPGRRRRAQRLRRHLLRVRHRQQLAAGQAAPYELRMVPHEMLDGLFAAVADATEEAILNALCAAETMTGFQGRTAYALPLEQMVEIVRSQRNQG